MRNGSMFIEFDEEEKIKDNDQKRNEFETITLTKEKK
jgi:hypothetical protein